MNTITVSQNGMSADIKQNWDDQDVLASGLAHKIIPDLTLRVGANIDGNPIKKNCTPLFPAIAIIKNHYTTG